MTVTPDHIRAYAAHLRSEERSAATVEKYVRNAGRFADWLGPRELSKEAVIRYKATLTDSVSTVNGAIASVNSLLTFLGHGEWRVKQLRTQRQIYRSEEKELSREEFRRLVCAAERRGSERLARAIETIAATGIRVSELRAFTVEAVRSRRVVICNKGKTRTVMLTRELAAKLMDYARRRGIRRGELFVTRSGRSLSRTQLWAEMKRLCREAGVAPGKVFPHNLRHLFAVVFYQLHRDIAKLADLLGHSSINTTRIYIAETGREHLRRLEAMRMVV